MAQRLSAAPAFMLLQKKLIPTFLLGVGGVLLVTAPWSFNGMFSVVQMLFAGTWLLGVFGACRNFVWHLADEVLDEGDALVVRYGRSVRRIVKADVFDVYVWYRRVELRAHTADGEARLAFMTRARWPPWSVDPRIKDLAERAKGRLVY